MPTNSTFGSGAEALVTQLEKMATVVESDLLAEGPAVTSVAWGREQGGRWGHCGVYGENSRDPGSGRP